MTVFINHVQIQGELNTVIIHNIQWLGYIQLQVSKREKYQSSHVLVHQTMWQNTFFMKEYLTFQVSSIQLFKVSINSTFTELWSLTIQLIFKKCSLLNTLVLNIFWFRPSNVWLIVSSAKTDRIPVRKSIKTIEIYNHYTYVLNFSNTIPTKMMWGKQSKCDITGSIRVLLSTPVRKPDSCVCPGFWKCQGILKYTRINKYINKCTLLSVFHILNHIPSILIQKVPFIFK
jgi:hypothetical protein